ncbi:MAG: type II secretion system protein GspG [Phycisphaerae bacterium]|jgi:hypothetical protein
MSTFQAPGGTFGVNPEPQKQAGSNWAGVAGFVVALISLVACCVPYVNIGFAGLALILCVVGLFHAKKGLAIAGLVISLVVLVLAILWTIFVGMMTSAFKPMGLFGSFKAFATVAAVEEYAKANNGVIPADLASTGQDQSMFTDGWDTPFEYTARGDNTYTVVSAGPDKQVGTSDDIDIGQGLREKGMGEGFPNLRALTDAATPTPELPPVDGETPAPDATTPPAEGEKPAGEGPA